MSDRDLQTLLRDGPEPEEGAARILLLKARAGEITQGELELAALCGHEPAARLVSGLAPYVEPLQFLNAAIPRFEEEFPVLAVRLAWGAAKEDLRWTKEQPDLEAYASAVGEAEEALSLVESWLESQRLSHLKRATTLSRRLPDGPSFGQVTRWTADAAACGSRYAPKWGTRAALVKRVISTVAEGSPTTTLPAMQRAVLSSLPGIS